MLRGFDDAFASPAAGVLCNELSIARAIAIEHPNGSVGSDKSQRLVGASGWHGVTIGVEPHECGLVRSDAYHVIGDGHRGWQAQEMRLLLVEYGVYGFVVMDWVGSLQSKALDEVE